MKSDVPLSFWRGIEVRKGQSESHLRGIAEQNGHILGTWLKKSLVELRATYL